jgi:hypothetical protein
MVNQKRGGKRSGAGRKKGTKLPSGEQVVSLQELARTHTELALNALMRVCCESGAPAVSAANSILDRGYGKAPQSIEHTGKDGGPIQTESLSELELGRRLAFLLAKAKRALS